MAKAIHQLFNTENKAEREEIQRQLAQQAQENEMGHA